MTHDITLFDENEPLGGEQFGSDSAPPLCLVHYFGADAAYPPERNPKPPGSGIVGRIAERRGNLIILEFASPPKPAPAKRRGRRPCLKPGDALFLLLLVACLIGCLAAFRF